MEYSLCSLFRTFATEKIVQFLKSNFSSNIKPRVCPQLSGRCSDLMVSALDAELSSPCLSPCSDRQDIVNSFLGKTLDSHIASLHPVV